MNKPFIRLGLSWPIILIFLALFGLLSATASAVTTGLPDFTELVERHSPAVVNISTTRKIAAQPGLPPGLTLPDLPGHDLGDIFRHFFGDRAEPRQPPQEYDTTSLGSGFIISADGYVVTNHHVVKQADEIIVRLSDRREFTAKVIGSDAYSDIALLKIEADGLPTLPLAQGDRLKVGEWVLAIGSPFGFDHSVTAGIVSAKGRSLPSENYVPFIQTDVAINPGNSGGPLFNMAGEVVGINSQIYSRTGGFMGLSFAIPIDVAMDVVDKLKAQGRVARGWLGVYIQPVTQGLAESFGLDRPYGALVAEVLPNSPAEQAGLAVGDIIVAFAGQEVSHSAALPPIVGVAPIGEAIEVKVVREGKTLAFMVTIGELPPDDQLAAKLGSAEDTAATILGMELGPVPDEVREDLELKATGVLVESVGPGAARDSGIRAGDVLVKIGNTDVESVEQAQRLLGQVNKERSVPVLIQRKQGPIYLPLRIK